MHSHFDPDSARDDGVSSLPVDAQQLYDILSREGAHWRANAEPDIARIDQRLRERIPTISATEAANQPNLQTRTTVGSPERGQDAGRARRQATRHPSMRRWVTTLATIAIVVAFVAILTVNAARRPGGASTYQMLTGGASATSATATAWVDLTRLDYSTSFSANDPPAIAPSDPRVVYETMAQGLQQRLPATMRMTTDGGATWRALATPVPADHIGYAGIAVSPINPQTVFLSLIDTTGSECPANRLEMGEGAGAFCRMEYTSTDGGASWRVTGLPLAGGSKPGLLTASINSGMAGPIQSDTMRAQGQRLFAGFICTDFSCTRLVTSVDGGRTWTFADQALLAGGAANVCDYTSSEAGATIYAVTSTSDCNFNSQAPLTLWRSDDVGATWAKVSRLATPNERGMELTQNTATGATLLYMGMPRTTSLTQDKMGDSFPVFSSSPGDVRVSADSGATWQSAPTTGIPAGHAVFLQVGLLGTLGDGSVVVDVIPPSTAGPIGQSNFDGSDLYAWKPGDAGWRKIASVPREIDSLLVTSSQAGAGDTLYTILVNRSGAPDTFVFLKMSTT